VSVSALIQQQVLHQLRAPQLVPPEPELQEQLPEQDQQADANPANPYPEHTPAHQRSKVAKAGTGRCTDTERQMRMAKSTPIRET
jgi:hypothetical protein